MRQRKWVSALQLNRWADQLDAKSRLPELIRRLIHGTVEATDLVRVDFAAGEETHRPGYDGVTNARRGNAHVPDGITYWELGTNIGRKDKFDKDFDKRLEKRGPGDFSGVTYIAVTPRDFQKKQEWADEKNTLNQWRQVRAYDSSDLEQWLENAAGVALWLSRYVSTPPEGLSDIATHWENLLGQLKRSLPPSVLLLNRSDALEAFKTWLAGGPSVLAVQGQSPQEVVDVFAAWVQSLPAGDQDAIASRGIIVDTADAWRELADSEQRLILIRSERLELDEGLIAEAQRKGHHVLVPISTARTQAGSVVRLDRIDRFELEKALQTAGLPEHEAYSLAQQSGGSFTVLKSERDRAC